MAVIGGFRCDLSIPRKMDGNFGNVSADICHCADMKDCTKVKRSDFEKNITARIKYVFKHWPNVSYD